MAAVSRLAFLGFLTWLAMAGGALAQKQGGILRQHIPDNPASLSIHEESTVTGERPAMAIFNNLVIFDQHVALNSMASIVPDLAEKWSWSEDGTKLTFQLRQGVKWHDGKPFTSADVKCTWDLLQGKGTEKLRINPRRSWYDNLVEVVPTNPYEAVFVLKRRQPAFLALLATGMSPVYRAMSRPTSCGSALSGPGRSNSSSSNRMKPSYSPAIRIIGSLGVPIWMASTMFCHATAPRRFWRSSLVNTI